MMDYPADIVEPENSGLASLEDWFPLPEADALEVGQLLDFDISTIPSRCLPTATTAAEPTEAGGGDDATHAVNMFGQPADVQRLLDTVSGLHTNAEANSEPPGQSKGGASKKAKTKRGPRPRLFRKHHCQADECHVNLATASFYYQRNHICLGHLKSESFWVMGVESRFCQRCGLSHPLTDFDGKRKSCRKALEKHNNRRRAKVQPKAATEQSSATQPTHGMVEELEDWLAAADMPVISLPAHGGVAAPQHEAQASQQPWDAAASLPPLPPGAARQQGPTQAAARLTRQEDEFPMSLPLAFDMPSLPALPPLPQLDVHSSQQRDEFTLNSPLLAGISPNYAFELPSLEELQKLPPIMRSLPPQPRPQAPPPQQQQQEPQQQQQQQQQQREQPHLQQQQHPQQQQQQQAPVQVIVVAPGMHLPGAQTQGQMAVQLPIQLPGGFLLPSGGVQLPMPQFPMQMQGGGQLPAGGGAQSQWVLVPRNMLSYAQQQQVLEQAQQQQAPVQAPQPSGAGNSSATPAAGSSMHSRD